MSGLLQKAMYASPTLRRLGWRAGRRLYCCARGEPARNEITVDGESYVQACVTKALPLDVPLCVADIGANLGNWTLSLLKLLWRDQAAGRIVRIHLFEPVPATVNRLRASLAGADTCRWTEVHSLAISNANGTAPIRIASSTGGTNSLHAGDLGTPEGGYVEVETITLADFCQKRKIGHIHLAKSDTEGHDMCVLRGACSLLAEGHVDAFQFEYNHRWVFSRHYLKDVFDFVAGLPYSVARIMPAHIEVLPGWYPELERFFEANYLLVKHDALGWFDVRRPQFHPTNTLI
jgi:FkbM family methyltransferase